MTEKCFHDLGAGSFFETSVYQRAVPEKDFLRQLDDVVVRYKIEELVFFTSLFNTVKP